MRILCEAAGSASRETRQGAGEALLARIKEAIGITVAVEVAEPGGVARSEGKAVRIIDKRPKG